MIAPRFRLLSFAAVVVGLLLQPSRAPAQWWSRAPVDFEECADKAEKIVTKPEKATALSECNAKFAGRRKVGGGYTYYDFMQNRSFDIAGPNPTADEQKHIDEQYSAFLEQERRNSIAAAFAAKQQQLQQASYRSETEKLPVEKTPVTVAAPAKPAVPATDFKSRMLRAGNGCTKHEFSCEWPRLSEGIKDLKKMLFGSPTGKAKHS